MASKLRQAGLDISLEEIVAESEPKSAIMQNESQDKKMKVYTGKEADSMPDRGRRLLILFGIIFLLGFLTLRYITESPDVGELSPDVGELRFNGKSLRIGMSKNEVLYRLNNKVDFDHGHKIGFWAEPFGVVAWVVCYFDKGTYDLRTIVCEFTHRAYSAIEFRDKLEGVINELIRMYGKPTKQHGFFGVVKEEKYIGVGGSWRQVEMEAPTYVGWKLESGNEIEYWYRDLLGPEYILRFTTD